MSSTEVRDFDLPLVLQEIEEYPEFKKIMEGLSCTISITGTSKSKEEEINHLVRGITEKRFQLSQNQRLMNCIKENLSVKIGVNSSSSKEIEKDVATGLLCNLLDAYAINADRENPSSSALFGLQKPNIEHCQQSNRKYNSVKAEVEDKLKESSKFVDNSFKCSLGVLHEDLFSLKTKVNNLMKLHNEMYNKYINLLEQSCGLRLSFLENVTLASGESLVGRIKLFQLNTEILKCQLLLLFYTEEENIPEAVNKLMNIMDNELCSLKQEILQLEEKHNAFKQLQGTEFTRILQDYERYLLAIENKKWVLQHLNMD